MTDERARLDLDDATRKSLEFDAILSLLSGEARTPPGRQRILRLRPTADRERAAARLASVAEARRFLDAHGKLVPGVLPDPDPALRLLEIEEALPEPSDLRDLAMYLAFARELRERVSAARAEGESFPWLDEMVDPIADIGSIVDELLGAVEPDGRLADHASDGLARIRREAARTGARLRHMLESLLHAPGSEGTVRDDFVTQRNGRFVIPVRSDAVRSMRGIVHGSSSSGATVFVEPLESLDTNNRLVQLREEELEEELRIVAGWMARLRAVASEVRECVVRVAEADVVQACALWAEGARAVIPDLVESGGLRVVDVRHPLLDRRLRSAGGACVPISIAIDPWDQVLVLSGPNTGGKTVALKTLGLTVLMAQSGIPVPARSASLPVYRQVRADIGDHQSLDADLSTFSAHLAAIRGFLEGLETPSLLLFDEIGTGTDPAEGAALAVAVLERFVRGDVTAAATTHHGAVKAWAFETEGVVSAALDFDRERLRPTYHVTMGTAGVSAGLDVADRCGLAPEIVGRARDLLGPDAARGERYLDRLREAIASVGRDADRLAERERELERRRESVDAEVSAAVRQAGDRATERFDEAVRSFRELGRRELETIRNRREREAARRAIKESARRLATEAARRKERVRRTRVDDAVRTTADAKIEPGTAVVVVSLDREGVVDRVRGGRVDVRLGKISFQVPIDDVRPTGAAVAPVESRPTSGARPRDDLGVTAPVELHLIGRTVDEAIPELDRFLDNALRSGSTQVRVVHGHGTGRLRAAVRAHLRTHPLKPAFRAGRGPEGGDGVTMVSLTDEPP